jgi:rhomboid protease GluP
MNMPILYENLTKPQADLCSLILSSSGILFRLSKDKNGFTVWVSDALYHRAQQSMQSYFTENRVSVSFPDKGGAKISKGSIISAILAGLILLAFYAHTSGTDLEQQIVDRYGSSARAILHGDYYRAVTSLMLHADMIHLVGNMVGMVVFGTAVCAVCGWGVGWLMILASGIFGNLINAYMYESGHLSIGASTAVFGAIGILSGYQLIRSQRFHQRRLAAWAPLACGLALLGLLGSGPHSDLSAHFFGFIAGIGMGLAYAMAVRSPFKIYYQVISIILVIFIISMAWISGWKASG